MSLLLQEAFCAPRYQQGIALVFLLRTLKDNPSYGVKSQRTICKNFTYVDVHTYVWEKKVRVYRSNGGFHSLQKFNGLCSELFHG